jgi:hypothetical protein
LGQAKSMTGPIGPAGPKGMTGGIRPIGSQGEWVVIIRYYSQSCPCGHL